MPSRIIFVGAATAVFLGAGTLALKLECTHRSTQQALERITSEVGPLEGALRSTQARLTEAVAGRTHAQKTLDHLREKPEVAHLSPKKETPLARVDPVRSAVLNNPKFQNLQLAANRGSLVVYAPFFQRLGLPTTKSEQVEALLAKRMEKNADLAAAAQSQGLRPDDSIVQTLKQQADEEFQTAQTALLGEDGFRQLQDYERELPVRYVVDQFAGTAAMAGLAVSGAQADQLVSLIVNSSPEYQRSVQPGLMNIDWPNALESATAVLTDAPLHLFKMMSRRHQIRRQLQDLAATDAGRRVE